MLDQHRSRSATLKDLSAQGVDDEHEGNSGSSRAGPPRRIALPITRVSPAYARTARKALVAQVDDQMRTSSIEALASAWARIAEEAGFPADYEGTASPEAHQASEVIQAWIRERIVATDDMRLFSLLHLLGQASLRMEQVLWPEDYERIAREIEVALRDADDPNAR